jgi:hypothetical protein
MALEKITASVVAKFNINTKQMDYYLIPPHQTWWVDETDVVISEKQVFVVELPALSQEEYTLKAITTLREKQKAAYEEASRTAARLEEKIKELQLLTWQVDPSVIDSITDLVLQPVQEEEDADGLEPELEFEDEDAWPESEDEIEDSEHKPYIDQTWE